MVRWWEFHSLEMHPNIVAKKTTKPMISPERIIELHRTFSDYVTGKRPIPKSYDKTSMKSASWAPPENDFRWKVAEAIKVA